MLPPQCRSYTQKTEPALSQIRSVSPSALYPIIGTTTFWLLRLREELYRHHPQRCSLCTTHIIAFNVPPHPQAEEAQREPLHFTEEEPEVHKHALLAPSRCERSQEHSPGLLLALQPHSSSSETAGSVRKHSALVFTYRMLNFIKNIFTNKIRETVTKNSYLECVATIFLYKFSFLLVIQNFAHFTIFQG